MDYILLAAVLHNHHRHIHRLVRRMPVEVAADATPAAGTAVVAVEAAEVAGIAVEVSGIETEVDMNLECLRSLAALLVGALLQPLLVLVPYDSRAIHGTDQQPQGKWGDVVLTPMMMYLLYVVV